MSTYRLTPPLNWPSVPSHEYYHFSHGVLLLSREHDTKQYSSVVVTQGKGEKLDHDFDLFAMIKIPLVFVHSVGDQEYYDGRFWYQELAIFKDFLRGLDPDDMHYWNITKLMYAKTEKVVSTSSKAWEMHVFSLLLSNLRAHPWLVLRLQQEYGWVDWEAHCTNDCEMYWPRSGYCYMDSPNYRGGEEEENWDANSTRSNKSSNSNETTMTPKRLKRKM